MSNTMLANTKKPITEWRDYVLYITNELTIKAASEIGGVNKNTSYLWRRKFFECVSEYQSKVMLGGDVWFDEIYFNVPGRETFIRDGKMLRWVSRNKIAVEVAIDSHGNSYCKVMDRGKPTSDQILSALKDHISKRARLFHDHAALAGEVGGTDFVYSTSDPECIARLRRINELCSLLKRIVVLHVGQKQKNSSCTSTGHASDTRSATCRSRGGEEGSSSPCAAQPTSTTSVKNHTSCRNIHLIKKKRKAILSKQKIRKLEKSKNKQQPLITQKRIIAQKKK